MNWLYQALNKSPQMKTEDHIDCASCTVRAPVRRESSYQPQSKCCEFSPFWSAFAVGAWLEEGHSLKAMNSGDWILTPLGVLHPLEHRQNNKSLCQHFNTQNNNCHIWSQRPAICFSFFCTSQYAEGLKGYSKLEAWLLEKEALALKIWFDHLDLDPKLWQKWGEYMEESPRLKSLPRGLLLTSFEEAEELYMRSWQSLKKDPFFRSFREQSSQSLEKQVADNPILC